MRFDPQVRAFIDAEADKLGISSQEFIAMTFKAIMTATHQPVLSELEMMLSRFADLFNAHDVAVADIPLLVPEIQRSDLMDQEKLADRLSPEVRERIADLFMVSEDWLKGAKSNPYDGRRQLWYKNPEGFATRLAYLKWQSRDVRVYFCVSEAVTLESLNEARLEGDAVDYRDMNVVVECERAVDGVSFRTYDVWEAQRWNYSRCRHYLKVLMRICEAGRVHYDGLRVRDDLFKGLCNGHVLAAVALERRAAWHPDQFFWRDERNLERDEMGEVEALFSAHEAGLSKPLVALSDPYRVTNWDTCFRRGFELSDTLLERMTAKREAESDVD